MTRNGDRCDRAHGATGRARGPHGRLTRLAEDLEAMTPIAPILLMAPLLTVAFLGLAAPESAFRRP